MVQNYQTNNTNINQLVNLTFQIHNFDIYTENLVLRPIHNNKSIYISFGSHTSLMEIYRKSHLRNTKIITNDDASIIRITSGRLECDSISIQYIKISNTRGSDVYAKSIYTGLSTSI